MRRSVFQQRFEHALHWFLMFELSNVASVTVNVTMSENSAGLNLITEIERSTGVSFLKNVVLIQ